MAITGALAARVRDRAAPSAGFARPADVYADFAQGVFRVGGARFGSADAFLGGAGGARNGSAYDFGPAIVGAEMLSNGTFDTDITGWTMVGGLMTAVLSWQAPGKLRMAAPGAGQQRAGQSQTRYVDRAYLLRTTMVRFGGSGTILSNEPTGGGTANGPAMVVPGDYALTWTEASGGVRHIGLNANYGVADYEEHDNVSLREVRPFTGFDSSAWSFMVRGAAPAALPGAEQVIFAGDSDSTGKSFGMDRDRVRLAWATNGDIKLVITRLNVEQVNLVVGNVPAGSAFLIRASLAANEVVFSLNDGLGVVDTVATLPGLAYLRLGRSRAGEAFGGTISEAGVWFGYTPIPVDPTKVFTVRGDSTAAGTWPTILAPAFDPDRLYHVDAVGGQGIATMRDKMIADLRRRDWPCIIYDRANTGETAVVYLAALAAAIGTLTTGRFLIMPQVAYADGAEAPAYQAILTEINEGIRARWPNNTFDAPTEANFLTALAPGSTRSDGLHRNATGAAIESSYIKTWWDAKGW